MDPGLTLYFTTMMSNRMLVPTSRAYARKDGRGWGKQTVLVIAGVEQQGHSAEDLAAKLRLSDTNPLCRNGNLGLGKCWHLLPDDFSIDNEQAWVRASTVVPVSPLRQTASPTRRHRSAISNFPPSHNHSSHPLQQA